MTPAQKKILHTMHERGEATRPQLAAATGLSEVTVGKAVAALCRSGQLRQAGEISSGGGRPVQLYHYNTTHAWHAAIAISREETLLRVHVQLLDLHGNAKKSVEGRFTYLEAESLDGLLETLLRGRHLLSITLPAGSISLPDELEPHLRQRFRCEIHTPSAAALLAQESEPGTATLCLSTGQYPSCAIAHPHGIRECGPLHLLPIPGDWTALETSDRNHAVEMVASLLVIITCTLAPERIRIYAPAWSSRLTERIRYNAATKLKGHLPPLHFAQASPADMQQATLTWCSAWRG